jgi:hypothetical protein
MRWGADPGAIHEQLGHAFHDVSLDRENRVIILTGTGDAFCKDRNVDEYNEAFGPDYWYRISREGRDILMNLLDIEVPVISAINGPATIHSELCVLADIVLAADTAKEPAVGAQPWPLLLANGRNVIRPTSTCLRRSALNNATRSITGPRMETSRHAGGQAINTLRYSRMLFAQPAKESLQRELNFGLALEGLSVGAMLASRA